MSRRYSLIIACTLVATQILAAVVSPEEAQQIAQDFMNQQTSFIGYRSPAKQKLHLTATRQKLRSAEPAYYVYGAEEGGFVLVSADDRTRPILGHAYRGYYDEQHFPENISEWLNYLTAQLSSISPSYLPAARKQQLYTTVDPLLDKIEWNQSEPYNNDCPSVKGEKCPTGCVATAAGQIMKYYEYPSKGRGSHSYEWNNQTLSVNFNTHSYNWDDILPSYNDGYNSSQADEVAELMSDIGIAFEMNYAPKGSGTNEYIAGRSMVEHFKYDSAMQTLRMDMVGPEKFEQTVAKELKAKRPVMMSGRSESSGHEFVCDGVNSDDLFHINWGWGGAYNGDFALTALYPEGQGIGGANEGDGYTNGVAALINIRPDKGNSPVAQLNMEKISILEEKKEFARDESFTLQINNFFNYGLFPWNGYFGFLICDEADNIVSIYYLYSYQILELNPMSGWEWIYFASVAVDNSVPDGEYQIVAAYTPSLTNKEWTFINYENGNPAAVGLTVTSSKITLTLPKTQEELDEEEVSKYLINLEASVKKAKENVRFSWETPNEADKYVVNVFVDKESQLMSSDTITGSPITVQFYYPDKLTYSWSVQALTSNDKVLAKRYGEDFEMEVTTDYSPYRLKHEIQGYGILFSWRGEAPAYHIEVRYDGDRVINKFLTETECFFPYNPEGEYTWSVRSMCQTKKFYISEAVTDSFTIEEDEAIDDVDMKDADYKYIQDGQLYIRKNDNIYDALG